VPPGRSGRDGSTRLLWVLIAVFAVLLSGGAVAAGLIAYRKSEAANSVDPTRRPTAEPGPSQEPGPSREPTGGPDDPTAPPSGAPSGDGGGVVTYEVTGDGPVRITYQRGARGGTEQIRNAKLPWRVEVQTNDDAFVVSIFATRLRANQGSITCRVLIDGEEVVSRRASGPRALVTCLKVTFD
jgi:hypothetical protein